MQTQANGFIGALLAVGLLALLFSAPAFIFSAGPRFNESSSGHGFGGDYL